MTLENLIDTLSVEDIEPRIIQEESRKENSDIRDEAICNGEKLLSSRDIICTHCNKKSHYRNLYWKLQPRKQKQHNMGKVVIVMHCPLLPLETQTQY